MRSSLFILLLPAIFLAGCTDGLVCTTEYVYGVTATVTNLETGQPITGAALTLTEGTYSETMTEMDAGTYAGAGERAGTYTLTAQAEGFAPSTIQNLLVVADRCHVLTVQVEIELLPN